MPAATEVVTQQPKPTEVKVVTYMPLGGKAPVELTMAYVKKFLCTPTRNGNIASDAEIVKFMMLCKARELDPWVGDAYLVGYDSKDGPVFSLITAVQALLKRAEMNPDYKGMEYGVVVTNKEGVVSYRDGDLFFDGETLVGGWARCYRANHDKPTFDALKLATFNTGRSRWEKDPGGMIVKCAQASVLRTAFPTQLGGLYTREELEHMSEDRIANRVAGNIAPLRTASNLDELASHIEQQVAPVEQPKQIANANATPPNTDVQPTDQPAGLTEEEMTGFDVRIGESTTDEQLNVIGDEISGNTKVKGAQKDVVLSWIAGRRNAIKSAAKKAKPGTQKELGE